MNDFQKVALIMIDETTDRSTTSQLIVVKDMRVGRRGQRRGEVRVMVMISRDSLVRRIQIAELDYKVES